MLKSTQLTLLQSNIDLLKHNLVRYMQAEGLLLRKSCFQHYPKLVWSAGHGLNEMRLQNVID